MTRTLLIDAIGTVIGIDGSALTDEAWGAAKTAWQDALVGARDGAQPAATILAPPIPTDSMLANLSITVTLEALKDRAGSLLLLHATGLATPDGSVVVLIGPSGRGKTTAARVLGQDFGYVSDESIGIAADGTVLPYRKPLSIIEDARQPKVQRSPSELGLRPLPDGPLRLAALVLLDRVTDAQLPQLEPVDIAEGIARIAEQASYLGHSRTPLQNLAAHIDAVGGVHRLRYSDAASLSPIIRELAGRRPGEQSGSPGRTIETRATVDAVQDPVIGGNAGPQFRRAQVLDAITLDEQRISLMVRDGMSTRVIVLDGIAPAIWRTAVRPASMPRLVEAAVAAHGVPQGAEAEPLVEAAVDELCALGVLARH